MADGILNTAQIMDILTEMKVAVSQYNEEDRQWDNLLCERTHKEKVRVPQRSMSYRPIGEGGTPARQRIDYQEISLPTPMRYGLGSAVTQQAVEDGIDRQTIELNHREALAADQRWVTKVVMRAMLLDGGWWDGSATPPPWKENTFLSTHDHYLAYNVSGIPALAHFTRMRRHILEHGFGMNGVVCAINGDLAEAITNIAEWATAPSPMATSTMDSLQRLGLTPSFMAGGVIVVESDWVPDNYAVAWAVGEKPLHWRMPLGLPLNAGVLTWEESPNVRTMESFDYVRRGSCAVTLRGAGCACYFGGAAWVDPTISLTA